MILPTLISCYKGTLLYVYGYNLYVHGQQGIMY